MRKTNKELVSKSASIATLKEESGRAEQADKSANIATFKCKKASIATLEQEVGKKGKAK